MANITTTLGQGTSISFEKLSDGSYTLELKESKRKPNSLSWQVKMNKDQVAEIEAGLMHLILMR